MRDHKAQRCSENLLSLHVKVILSNLLLHLPEFLRRIRLRSFPLWLTCRHQPRSESTTLKVANLAFVTSFHLIAAQVFHINRVWYLSKVRKSTNKIYSQNITCSTRCKKRRPKHLQNHRLFEKLALPNCKLINEVNPKMWRHASKKCDLCRRQVNYWLALIGHIWVRIASNWRSTILIHRSKPNMNGFQAQN